MVKAVYLLLGLGVFVYSCGSSDDHKTTPDSEAGAAGDASSTPDAAGGGAGPSQSPSAAGEGGSSGGAVGQGGMLAAAGVAGEASAGEAGAGEASAGGAGGQPNVVLPDGVIVDVPYSCASPFEGVAFDSYFHLENFEDGALDAAGVTTSSSTLSSSFGAGLVDSVDCDDGVVDGTCAGCDALYGNGSLEVGFDAGVLGQLPSHVGMVWTDGGADSSVTITGYDASDSVIYSESVPGIGDTSIYGTVEEDRFFGIVHYEGIKRVTVLNSTGGVEIDHLQYGR
jgi:hypothetical protein